MVQFCFISIMNQRQWKLIYIIFGKCLKMVVRNQSNQALFILSILIVYGGLGLMWILTSTQNVSYLSSQPYAKLEFDFQCVATSTDHNSNSFLFPRNPRVNNDSIGIQCSPMENMDSISTEPQTTPSDVLLQWLYTGSPVTDEDSANMKLLELISSLMMNGIPLVGLDGYVEISDAANKYFGRKMENKILSSATLREQFDGFFHVRHKRFIITPNNICTKTFIEAMRNTSKTFSQLNVEVQNDINLILEAPNCCADIWAIIELIPSFPSDEICNMSTSFQNIRYHGYSVMGDELSKGRPSVTIRMNPSSIPDTRNFDWTPLKRVSSRLQSGELLYFTSGFLSLQLELQQFIENIQFGHSISTIPTANLDWQDSILHHHAMMLDIAAAIVNASTPDDLRSEIKIVEAFYHKDPNLGNTVHFPLFHRAFPTRKYTESLFWHLFGTLMTIALIILFALPAAITLGCFKKESVDGQIDVLSTMPSVKTLHSLLAWYFVGFVGIICYSLVGVVFFKIIFGKSSVILPTLGLAFMGISLGPIFALIGDGFKKPDSLILAIPAFTFISTLPGLLYFDLAYDTQRYLWIEVLLCLLPPSGIAILLRLCFSNEAIGISVGWMHRAPVSNTPALLFMGMLLFDAFLWLSLSAWQIDLRERMPRVKGNDTSNWFLNRFKCSCNLFGWPIPQNRYCEVGDNVDHQQYEKNDCAIEVLHLRKFYNSGSDSICVLDNINAQLSWRQITVLLGSNGAGKTTFMKILSGLDTDYGGAVKLANCGSGKKRWIGWCPQSDSLYPFLTVNEHLEFFESLMECTTARISSYSIQDRIQIALQNLAMVEHRFTPAHLLSGGMKRRLSLALAFVGNPTILLLDEPTSGCDSWTRELVRRDILSRKTTSCIVVSTHHSDDVEVLADNIWFLNERHLVLNKPVEHLFSDREELRLAGISHRPVKFSTSTLFIKSQFVRFFGEALSLALQPVGMIHDNPPYSWIIPPSFSEKLISFVKYLDNLQEHDWTLEHYTVFSAISSYYGNQEVDGDSDRQRSRISSDVKFPKLKWIQSFMIIVRIRWIDLRKHLRSFFLSHLILPFMVAYFLALGCRDISYPKVKITSDNFHSMGEVPISMGHRNNDFDQSKLYSVVPQASWKGILNSDQLWNKLYEEYYQHTQNRWGAMVLNDVSPDWLETSLLINQGSMALPPAEVIDALGRFCNSSISYQRFCGAIVIELENKTHHNQVPDIFNDAQIGVILKSHQGLTTNFTLMSNVTSDHAAPVFVKEILSLLASLVRHNVSTSTEPLSGAPQYDLYSFPLPESNVVNKRYLERGFLGSTLATMYLLMTIVSCVKFVTKLNGSRMKRQLHSHGVSPVEYWLGHWIFDVCKVLWAVFAIFGGIYCGGNPIANFFFFSPALYGSVAIVGSLLFSLAIVSSSFTMVIFWEDILGSQLFILLTTISNGIFIKMYLDRRHSPTYEILINLCILISPAFSFTTIMFDIFKAYARCAMKGLLRQHDQIEIVYDMFARTRYCCGVLIIQAMVYLVICIMLDYYQFQLLYFIKSIRWKFSAQWMCSDIRNMLQESESFPTIHKLSVSSPSSCGGYGSIAGPLQDLTVSAGSRMREHLTFHPDYRVGLFPFLTRSTFKVAANKIKDDVPPISDDNDGDIEMRPLLSPISSRVLFPTEDTVECRDLCVDGNGSDSDLKLSLCNVSFKVPPSSRTAIMSMNGGGKTTLFDVLTGARSPVHGTAKICGKDVVANQFEIGKLSLVGYVPQEDSLLDFLTVRETLQLFSDLSRNFGEREHFVDSPDFLPRKYDQYPVCALSGGTKKKLSLAVANMHNPRLLLLDECTTGVDPISATSIIDYLHRNLRTFQSHQTFSQGLLFASHRVDEAFALCDEVLMLVNGQVFLQCPSLAFVELVHRYYQVDVYVCVDACADNVRDVQESFLGRLFECIGGKTSVERIVIYGQVLIRLTFRKSQVSVTKLWNKLDMWRYHGLISKYLFRSMEMEEILATILVASKVEHT